MPWVADGIDLDELQVIEMFVEISGEDLDLAQRLAAAAWVNDGMDFSEVTVQRHIVSTLGSDMELARRLVELPLALDLGDELDRSQVEDIIALHSLSQEERAGVPLLDRLIDSDWYQDGLDDNYEPHAVRSLKEIQEHNLELANVVSKWDWVFDGDMLPHEWSVVDWVAVLGQDSPDLVPTITDLPWVSDGIDRWEASTVANLAVMLIEGDSGFAVELATAPWVVDGITVLEDVFGTEPLSRIATQETHSFFNVQDGSSSTTEVPHGPEMAREVMDLIDYPPQDLDLYLIYGLNIIRTNSPETFERLFKEPRFIDGLEEDERIYLVAASGAARWDRFFDPYTLESRKIVLPHSGEVNLWAVQYGLMSSGPDVLAQMEEAVRGSERFWGLPFPVDEAILFLEEAQECRLRDPHAECRGRHIGRMMFLYTDRGDLSSQSVHHEIAHYYFNSGPRWFAEGGAELVELYIAHDGHIPPQGPWERCAQGFNTLQGLNDLGSGPLWDSCSYHMGRQFLGILREAMGHEVFVSALRAFYLEFGYQELYVSTADSPGDEDVYGAFISQAPPESLEKVKDIFRELHGGPFTIANASSTDGPGD